jgi:hypothetical protein
LDHLRHLKHPYHHLQSSHNQGEMTAAIMILTDAIKFQKLESRNDNPPQKNKKNKKKKRKEKKADLDDESNMPYKLNMLFYYQTAPSFSEVHIV